MTEFPNAGQENWIGQFKAWVEEHSVIGVGIRRIIVSANPGESLEDGDLLVLLEAPSYFTDFSQFASDDWDAMWAQNATWSIADDAEATGGKVLRGVSASSGRNAYIWTGLEPVRDVEIAYRWRCNPATSRVRAVFRASGGAGSEHGYTFGYDAPNVVPLFRYINGSSSALGSWNVPPVTADTWHTTRVRANASEGRIAFRTWADGNNEPTSWDIEYTGSQPITDPGHVGIMVFSTGTVDVDWIGVGYDGAPAPTSAIGA